jgi:hypothetical protein
MTPGAARPGARSLVVGFRVLLLLLAGGAAVVAKVVGGPPSGAVSADAAQEYVCPMHPEVTASEPGLCPICRMELELAHGGGVGRSAYQVYDYVRRRGFGQDLVAPAWVDDDGTVIATLYKDELAALAPDERSTFSPASAPDKRIDVRPTADAPEPWDRSTSRARFHVDAHGSELSPLPRGETGWLRMGAQRLAPLVIASAAILEGRDGPYVLVASADGRTLAPRRVEVGRVLGGLAVVLSGLRIQERILVRSAFFVDAERRLRQKADIELVP